MQPADTESTVTHRKIVSPKQHRRGTYSKVMDKRKRPIRGLWERNGRYYAQLTVEDQITGMKQVKRVPLEGVRSTTIIIPHWRQEEFPKGHELFGMKVRGIPGWWRGVRRA